MPRVQALKHEYLIKDLSSYISGALWKADITQGEAAKEIGISQQTLSYRLKNNCLTTRDLIILFKLLDTDPETIVRLLKV